MTESQLIDSQELRAAAKDIIDKWERRDDYSNSPVSELAKNALLLADAFLAEPDLSRTCQPGNIWETFHRAWGQAQESPEYDKAIWLVLEKKVLELQRAVEKASGGGV